MKKALLVFLIAMLAGAWLIGYLEHDNGYVLIVLGDISIETSFWFALLLALLGLVLLWLTWTLLRISLRAGSSLSSQIKAGSTERAQRRTNSGLIDFIEGNWRQARKKLLGAANRAPSPLINYLAAARCAYEMGDREAALADLHRAEQSSDSSELAVALTQARMQLAGKRYEQCLATLERARRKAPKHPVVLFLLRQVYTALQDWDALEALLKDLRHYRIGSDDELDALEREMYAIQLGTAADRVRTLPEEDRAVALKKIWMRLPGHLQRQTDMVLLYARQLVASNLVDDAEPFIRKMLPDHWHPDLVRLYGRLPGGDSQKRLITAEGWLKQRPGDAVLMLTLGRLSLGNQLWGRAREYFQNSLRLRQDPETCAELARLLAHLGEHEKSTAYYQQGLLLTTESLPDLPQPRGKTDSLRAVDQ